MNKSTKHINTLERSRALLMQISIIASLLIVLIVFETQSSSFEENIEGFTEINIEIEKYQTNQKNIKPPIPNIINMGLNHTNNKVKLIKNGFEYINLKIDKQAQFIGGEQALRTYLIEQKQYSNEAKKNDIQGRVNVSFIIDENGKVKDVKIIRSIHPLIDIEALRLINAMPDWKPAKANGKQVKSKQILPVMFINS